MRKIRLTGRRADRQTVMQVTTGGIILAAGKVTKKAQTAQREIHEMSNKYRGNEKQVFR